MDLNEKNIFFKNPNFPSLDDFQVQNNQKYFFEDNFLLESDLEEFNPGLKINAELFSFNNEHLNELNDLKEINRLSELYYENQRNDKYLIDKKYFESIQLKIKENILLKKPFKEKKMLGRRKKGEKILGEHNKYSDDNLIRKCKNIILQSAFNFINKKIRQLYLDKVDGKILLKLKQNQSINQSNLGQASINLF